MIVVMGISCFVCSVLISVLVVYLTFRLFSRLLRSSDLKDLEQGNTAMAIAVAGDMIAFGILMARCLYPVSAVLQDLFFYRSLSFASVLLTLGFIGAYTIIGYILSVITGLVSSKLFQKMTASIQELELIRKNNIAVAIVLAGIVITVAIMVQSGLSDALNTLIPQAGPEDIRVR